MAKLVYTYTKNNFEDSVLSRRKAHENVIDLSDGLEIHTN